VNTDIAGLDRRLDSFAHRLDGLADVKAELRMHRGVLGCIVALNIGILARLLTM
jgi:hypothetical protein